MCVSLTEDGIEYLDETGNTQFIAKADIDPLATFIDGFATVSGQELIDLLNE